MEWQDLRELHERIRWSRMKAGFDRPTDGARSLGIKPVTYRTYEIPREEGGREPPLSEIQRMARKFGVNWIWLAAGEKTPDPEKEAKPDPIIKEIEDTVVSLDQARRKAALNAALSVVVSLADRKR